MVIDHLLSPTLLRIQVEDCPTVIDQVQRRIVGNPAPGRAAADLPLIALPGLDAGILADRLAELGGLLITRIWSAVPSE